MSDFHPPLRGELVREFEAWATSRGFSPPDIRRMCDSALRADRWLARYRVPATSCNRSDVAAWLASKDGQRAGEEGIASLRTFLRFLVDLGYRRASARASAPTTLVAAGSSTAGLRPAMRVELYEWDVIHGVCSTAVACHWMVVNMADRWLSRYRRGLLAASREDIDAWVRSKDGRALAEGDQEGLLEAIRTFLRFAESKGYRKRRASPRSRRELAPVLEIRERVNGSTG